MDVHTRRHFVKHIVIQVQSTEMTAVCCAAAVDAMRKNDRTIITQVSNYADVRNLHVRRRNTILYCFVALYRGTQNSIALFGNRAIYPSVRPSRTATIRYFVVIIAL